MSMFDVVTVQGVGERVGQPQPRMAELVMAHLDPDRFREVPVTDYVTVGPVGVNPGPSLEAAVARVERSVVATIDATPNPAVLVGYSGGALVAGNVADQIGLGLHPRLDVRAVVLIADPAMPAGISQAGHGVYASREVAAAPTTWACNPRDPICCAENPSPLRTVADQVAALSLGAPDVWAEDLRGRLLSGRWQPSAIDWRHPLATFQRYGRAADQLAFYLSGGHFTAYRPAAEHLADFIDTVCA